MAICSHSLKQLTQLCALRLREVLQVIFRNAQEHVVDKRCDRGAGREKVDRHHAPIVGRAMTLHETLRLETLQHACHCTDVDADSGRKLSDAARRPPVKVPERYALLVADLVNRQPLVSQRSKGSQYFFHLTCDLASIHRVELAARFASQVICHDFSIAWRQASLRDQEIGAHRVCIGERQTIDARKSTSWGPRGAFCRRRSRPRI